MGLSFRGPEYRIELDAMSEFLALFNPGIFDDARAKAGMQSQLARGRALVIPNAFRSEVADAVHAELDASKRWRPYEGAYPHFHYRHHNLYSDDEIPERARDVRRIFDSEEAKEVIGALAARDCAGPLDFGASLYLPGDHSLPHQDFGLGRSVAFVWHLTKRWDASWGGGLFWCPSGTTLIPQFNCLTLFTVSSRSSHFVTVVSPHAREKRLSINGWWTAAAADRTQYEPGDASSEESELFAAGYGAPVERVESATKIISM
jgi:hypothetical protein